MFTSIYWCPGNVWACYGRRKAPSLELSFINSDVKFYLQRWRGILTAAFHKKHFVKFSQWLKALFVLLNSEENIEFNCLLYVVLCPWGKALPGVDSIVLHEDCTIINYKRYLEMYAKYSIRKYFRIPSDQGLNYLTTYQTYLYYCNIVIMIDWLHTSISISSFIPCQLWPISLFPLVNWSERSTSRWSSELSRADVGPPASPTTPLDPKLPTGNLASSSQVWLLGGGWKMAKCSHRANWAGREMRHVWIVWLCWIQSVKYKSLQNQSCKVSRNERFCLSRNRFLLGVFFVSSESNFLAAGPQCVPRRVYSITTGGSRSQLFVAVEGTGVSLAARSLTENQDVSSLYPCNLFTVIPPVLWPLLPVREFLFVPPVLWSSSGLLLAGFQLSGPPGLLFWKAPQSGRLLPGLLPHGNEGIHTPKTSHWHRVSEVGQSDSVVLVLMLTLWRLNELSIPQHDVGESFTPFYPCTVPAIFGIYHVRLVKLSCEPFYMLLLHSSK